MSHQGKRAPASGIRDQFQPGDRVEHFDYGLGTFNAIGPAYVYIAWDAEDSMRASAGGCHDWHIVYYLVRIDPAAAPTATVQSADDLAEAQEHELVVGRALRGRMRWWLRTNGVDAKEDVDRDSSRFTFRIADEQWEQLEKWLADQPRPELPRLNVSGFPDA